MKIPATEFDYIHHDSTTYHGAHGEGVINMKIDKKEFEKLCIENGAVEHNGKTLACTQQAYCDNYNEIGTCYKAKAIDIDGNSYTIIWSNLSDGHRCDGNGDCIICGKLGCVYEDESLCADWETPVEIIENF